MILPIKIVVIHSLSFTGTTWINTLLGCHERAFAMGPPDRVVNLRDKGWDDACRVHGENCSFWPDFYRKYDKNKIFFLQLASAAQKDYIIINNPILQGVAGKELDSPDIIVKDIYVVRDGRAVCASYCRHYPESDFYDVVKDWFMPSAVNFPFDPDNPDTLSVRYEDVVGDQHAFVRNAGRFLGLEYPENFYKFWEFDHHITAGNAGTISMIRRFQEEKIFTIKERDFYEGEYQRLKDQPDKPMIDERWKDDLGERELFIFDRFCGSLNERWGYPRDRFSVSRIEGFMNEIKQDEGKLPLFSPGQKCPKNIDLRKQLNLSIVRSEGIHLEPRQLKPLLLLCLSFYGLSLFLVALIMYLITKW